MQRPQKTTQVGCSCEGMLETESNKRACSIATLETEREDGAVNALKLLNRSVLGAYHTGAYQKGAYQKTAVRCLTASSE